VLGGVVRSSAPSVLLASALLLAAAPLPASAGASVGSQPLPTNTLGTSNASSVLDVLEAQREEVSALAEQLSALLDELAALKAGKPQAPGPDASDAAKAAYQRALALYQSRLEMLTKQLAATQKKVEQAQDELGGSSRRLSRGTPRSWSAGSRSSASRRRRSRARSGRTRAGRRVSTRCGCRCVVPPPARACPPGASRCARCIPAVWCANEAEHRFGLADAHAPIARSPREPAPGAAWRLHLARRL